MAGSVFDSLKYSDPLPKKEIGCQFALSFVEHVKEVL